MHGRKRIKSGFFKRAERQLKAAGIDFVQVDREQIGVKEWNAEKQTAGAVYAYTQGAAVYVKDVEVLGQMSVYTEAQLKINSDSITQEVKRAKGITDLIVTAVLADIRGCANKDLLNALSRKE